MLHDIGNNGNKTLAVKMDNHSTISTYCNFGYIKLIKAVLKFSYKINNFPTLQFESVYTLPIDKNPPKPCVQNKIKSTPHLCMTSKSVIPATPVQLTWKYPTKKTVDPKGSHPKKIQNECILLRNRIDFGSLEGPGF